MATVIAINLLSLEDTQPNKLHYNNFPLFLLLELNCIQVTYRIFSADTDEVVIVAKHFARSLIKRRNVFRLLGYTQVYTD